MKKFFKYKEITMNSPRRTRSGKIITTTVKNKVQIKEEVKSTNQYFSPKYNKNHIKIEYELATNKNIYNKKISPNFMKKENSTESNIKNIAGMNESTFVINSDFAVQPLKKEEIVSPFFIKSEILNPITKIEQKGDVKISPYFEKSPENSSTLKRLKNDLVLKEENGQKQAKWEPNNWKLTLENIRKMRQSNNAPVDEFGCRMCSDKDVDEKTKRFHILVALMLSSQTKDKITFDAMERLKIIELTPENIIKIEDEMLEKLLYPVGFYKTKTKYIKKTSQILIEHYESDIPQNVADLIKLPGVGPKMAHICMKEAWNKTCGIGVDTHVHRITNRLKWTPCQTKNPEKTRVSLESWIPYELWDEINILLVGFGQTICLPIKPKCDGCLNKEICPFNSNNSK